MKKIVCMSLALVVILMNLSVVAFAAELDTNEVEEIDVSEYSSGEFAVYTDTWRTICTQTSYSRNVTLINTGNFPIYLVMYATWSPNAYFYDDTLLAGCSRTYYVGNDVTKVAIIAVTAPTKATVSW